MVAVCTQIDLHPTECERKTKTGSLDDRYSCTFVGSE